VPGLSRQGLGLGIVLTVNDPTGLTAVPDEAGPSAAQNRMIWAWRDEPDGVIRARVFVPQGGIAEDEATGSAALRLAAAVGRPIEIRQGRGSVLYARPLASGLAEVGGRVELEEVRSYRVEGAS